MNENKLRKQWEKEEKASFKGWNFSHLNNRWEYEKLPRDYKDIVLKYLKLNKSLLDMGTGGGEFLLSLNHPYNLTSVTEAWQPNIDLCKEKLEPLGICVRQVLDDNHIPYEDNSFDIVINRHEAYSISEIKRVLKPNGLFISQQVGGKNNRILSEKLIENFSPQFPKFDLSHEVEKFKELGFEVLFKDEYYPYLRFFDIGAVVYFAKVIEWEFPKFSVGSCFERLCILQNEIEEKGYVESLEHRFIFIMKNMK